ncbi:CheR family methyltransferase [Maridesulfovibrio zosterae]|uniref:CheR family methyltransferase n=1 Tax=Maridesulfovibrio zosterae TaxID=82171 RepID=UPI00040AD7F3|nr:protein-glutamate O-methyltransferase CheR [Maridesulfovibrio zosterae]
MKIEKKEFDLLRKQIYSLCGLIIPDGKEYLIEHRFSQLFSERKCRSWGDFYNILVSNDAKFKDEVVSAISTNETSFFRDNHPFNSIKSKVLPALVNSKKKHRKIRIWCAASSTGQEPYSLAMLIHEFCNSSPKVELAPSDFSILATDISSRVLGKAKEGVFTNLEVSRGLPGNYSKYFTEDKNGWFIKPEIKSMVEFKKFNLLNSFNVFGQFDFIMCRNVLIYFDDSTKLDIVHRIHKILPEHGYLMLGATETLAGHTDRFIAEHHGVVILYKKNGGISKPQISKSKVVLKGKKTFTAI